MASVETTAQLKRERDETQVEENKKHKKPYSNILDDEEEPSHHDISFILTTLHHEPTTTQFPAPSPLHDPSTVATDLEDSSEDSVLRRLLEASDDELGIPAAAAAVRFDEVEDRFGDGFVVCDGLWELEDEAANYYTLLQSELFM